MTSTARLPNGRRTRTIGEVSVIGRVTRLIRKVISDDPFLLIIPTTALVLGVLWAGLVPLWQIPDEPSHYAYVQSIAEGKSLFPERPYARELVVAHDLSGLDRLPFNSAARQEFSLGSMWGPSEYEVMSIPKRLRRDVEEGSYNPAIDYPPGYYMLASFVYRALGSHDLLTIMFGLRILSAVITSVTVLFSYLTLRMFFEERGLSRAATFLIVLSPMYIYMGMAVNVDVLLWMLFGLYIYLLTLALERGVSYWLSTTLALVVGIGLWVKQTFLIGIVFYLFLLVFEHFMRSTAWTKLVRLTILFLGTIFLIAGWLYFGGSIATTPYRKPFASFNLSDFVGHLIDNWRTYRWAVHDAFWGFFGWFDAPLSPALYRTIGFFSFIGFLSFLYYLKNLRKHSHIVAIFFLVLIIVFVGAMSFLNYSVVSSGEGWLLQGRYFFPLMAPIFAILLTGLTWFMRGGLKVALVLAAIGAMVVFHALALFNHVIPRYYL